MLKPREQVYDVTRHAARARLSRVIRNSEAGWLFYSPGGTAYHILTDEAAVLERRGLRLIDKCSWFAAELAGLPKKVLGLALIVLLAPVIFHPILKPFNLGVDWASNTFAGLVLFALFFTFLHPLMALAMRNTIMLVWQAREAKRLRRLGRGHVPAQEETKHRRYNLFRIIFSLALTVLTIRFFEFWLLKWSVVNERGFAVEIVCVAILAATAIPARMIDVTHIRRKWLD